MAQAVISAIGHDRPGLVSDITSIADRLGLNIEDSRMTVLGGEFAVLMALVGEPSALDAFRDEIDALCATAEDLAYIFRTTEARSGGAQILPYAATVVSLDQPGIVAAIATFFSQRQINIRDLQTGTSPAAHTGTPIFNVTLIAEVPAGTRIGALKQAFESFCDDEDLDGTLEAHRQG